MSSEVDVGPTCGHFKRAAVAKIAASTRNRGMGYTVS